MSNIATVVQDGLALSAIVLRAAEAQQRINQLLSVAHQEQRDLTDAEVAQIQSERRDAVERWHSLA